MKRFYSIVLLAVPCVAHPHAHHSHDHTAALLAEKANAGLESGAARIIHSIRGAEKALAEDLHGQPELLLSEERLLHRASQMALKAGRFRAKELHSMRRLHDIEASLVQGKKEEESATTEQSAAAEQQQASGEQQFKSIAQKEVQLLRGGRGILKEVRVLKADVAKALGQSDPEVTAKLEHLMDKVGGAQKDILRSEAQAASHASKLAASIRKEKTRAPGAFTQASSTETMGTRDPVKRIHLAEQALEQLKLAKGDVAAAYGDAGTAQKVESMMDQLTTSLQGLKEGDEADVKDVDEVAKAAKAATIRKIAKKKAVLAQSSARVRFSKEAVSRRFRRQGQRLRNAVARTRRIALEDNRIAKESVAASRVVNRELAGTEVGEEVSALLRTAAAEAHRASAADRRLASVQAREVHSLADLARTVTH